MRIVHRLRAESPDVSPASPKKVAIRFKATRKHAQQRDRVRGFRKRTRGGLWKVTGRNDRKRTRDETRSFQPRQPARGSKSQVDMNERVSLQFWPMSPCFRRPPLGAGVMQFSPSRSAGSWPHPRHLTIVRADPGYAETPLVRMAYIRSGSCKRRARLYLWKSLILWGSLIRLDSPDW